MRIIAACFLAMSILVSCLLISASPAIAWSDTIPHYATGTSCTTHVNTPYQNFTVSTYTFSLCPAASQATSMYADVYNLNMVWLCGGSSNGNPPPPISVTCNNIPLGTVTATVSWYVGPSPQMSHADGFKRVKP